ncbi:MAG: DUF5680 domain-containing protein [Patescibacteria group bacterium]
MIKDILNTMTQDDFENQKFILNLNNFLGMAMLKTYAGGGMEVNSKEEGFRELEYKDGDFYYKDSFGGHRQSWGREVVWYKDKPVWSQLYGGGMEKKYQNDKKFTHETFDFLKKAMSAGEKKEMFQPRGPTEYIEGDWKYEARWTGNIERFLGHEDILYKSEVVFTHDFFGGFYRSKLE